MYTTCIACHAPLGRNELVEAFPVGRRLAFDEARGRLWVVCRLCGRWNLSPLEARWEAIEACERAFRGLRTRVSTEHIGLAVAADGTSLVRVGSPLQREFAAWRYGRRFRWRRLRAVLGVGGGVSAAATVAFGGLSAGLGIGAVAAAYGVAGLLLNDRPGRVVAHLPHEGRVLRVTREALEAVRAYRERDDGEFGLVVHHRDGVELLEGARGRLALSKLMPAINREGADADTLDEASSLLRRAGDTEAYVQWMYRWSRSSSQESLTGMPEVATLALEMALHADLERRALEGELALLETAWREAEEVAAIADGLLLPTQVLARLDALRGRTSVTRNDAPGRRVDRP